MPTRDAADIQIRASLIDDYLQVEDAPVAPGLTGRFVALQDPAAPSKRSLVTVHPDGSLIQFAPDPTSHSGWAVATVPVTPPAKTAAQPNRLAGYVQGGTSNLLAYFPVQGAAGSAAVWMQAEAGGSWAQAQLTHDSENALGYTYQTDTYIDAEGNQYLYGLTGNISPAAFFLVAFDSDENAWDVVYEQFVTQFSPTLTTDAIFRLMPGTGGNTFNVLWIDQGVLYFQGAQLADGNFSWTTPSPAVLDLGLGTAGVQQIIAMPGAAGDANLVVIDGSSRLLLVENYTSASPTVVQLSGATGQPTSVQSASVGVAGGGLLMLFAAEKDTNSLWILRQTGTGAGGAPAFTGWVNLGNAVDAVACPPSMLTDAEIYAVDLQQTVYHFSQTADRVWASQKLAAPTPSTATPKNVAATTMHVTVLDNQGAPIGGAVVTVTSDQPATLIVNNLSYHVGPNTPATVQADPTGNLTAVLSTISLLTPVFTFTVTNTDDSMVSRWCHGDVVEIKPDETPIPPCQQSVATRLANQDPTKPINSTTLSKAGLISPSYADPDGAATAVVASGQWLQQHPQSVGNSFRTDHIKMKHWKIDFTHPSGPQFSVLTEEESRRMVEEARARRAAAAADGQVGDLQGFLGDILNFFKHLWKELESISAHVLDDVLHLLVNGVEFIVQTLREAADALETVFNRIIQGLKDLWQAILDVINFLKQLFEWGDILLTHRVIKAAINSFMTTLAADTGDLATLVNEKFQTLETEVKNFFKNAEQVFQPSQTFNQFANAQGGNPAGGTALAALLGGTGGNALAAGAVNTAFAQHGPRCNYVHSYAKSYYGGAGAGTLPRLTAALGDTQAIIDLVTQKWADLSQQTSNIQGFVTGKISSPQDFFDLVILDFLIAIEDAVLIILNGLEDIMVAVLQAAGSAISGLQLALNATVDIPVISWLYKYVITGTPTNPGDDLSILDVLSLIFAVPATILYKVMNNDQAPFSNTPEVQQIIANGLPWPPVPTQANIRARVPAPAALRDISPTTITALGLVAGFANFFGTFITMAADDMAFTGTPMPGFISWCSVTLAEVSQAMGAPLAVLATEPQNWTLADKWTVALWSVAFGPLAYDTAFTIGTGGLARFTDVAGPILDTGGGLLLTGIGSAAAYYQGKEPSSCTGSSYTGWDQANSVVPQIGRIFKCLILTKDLETALPLLSVLDLVLGIGSMVTQIGDAIHG